MIQKIGFKFNSKLVLTGFVNQFHENWFEKKPKPIKPIR